MAIPFNSICAMLMLVTDDSEALYKLYHPLRTPRVVASTLRENLMMPMWTRDDNSGLWPPGLTTFGTARASLIETQVRYRTRVRPMPTFKVRLHESKLVVWNTTSHVLKTVELPGIRSYKVKVEDQVRYDVRIALRNLYLYHKSYVVRVGFLP